LGEAIQEGGLRPGRAGPLSAVSGVLAFTVPDLPDLVVGAPQKQLRLMSRAARLASATLHAILEESRWSPGDRDGIGYYLGVGGSGGSVADLEAIARASVVDGALSMERLGGQGLRAASPLTTFQLMNNLTLCHGAIAEGLAGPNGAFFSRGGGTVVALMEALRSVETSESDRAVAGGADSVVHPIPWASLVREGHSGPGVFPGEGAAALALAAAGDVLAWVDECEVLSATAEDLWMALGTDPRAPPDLVVIAPWGPDARDRLASLVKRLYPGVGLLDISLGFGNAMAATPALAWVVALDRLVASHAGTVEILSLGVDDQLGMVRLRSPARARVRAPAGSADGAGVTSGQARAPSNRIVISGVGVVSAFGVGASAFFDGLAMGKSAVGPIRSFDTTHSPVRVAGEVPVVRADETWLASHIGHEDLVASWARDGHLRDRKVAFAVLAALEAWRCAGCGRDERGAWLSLGLGLERVWFEDFAEIFDGEHFDWGREIEAMGPRTRLRSRVDTAASCASQLLGLAGPSIVNTSACAAGALAIAHGAALIERGEAEVVVAGGADSMVDPMAIGGFWNLGALSPRNESDACRPFDVRRDGLVIGEGAAVFVIESEARARSRGVRPLATILGWGSTQDAYRVTAPRQDGRMAQRAMEAAMTRAGVSGSNIGWISAHGTGTPLNDPAEAHAIRGALGRASDRVPVSSIKGAVGHLIAAAGAIEIASCLIPFSRELLPGTAHHRDRDPDCDLDIIAEGPRRALVDVVLSNSFGFGGQNACVILGRV
jgi:3-oxoacyl-[acyl-carrier-protein] synthase II